MFSGDVGSGAMDGLEQRSVFADVAAGGDAETTHETSGEIRHDVPIQVLHQKHVELIWIHDKLHAQVVYDLFVVLDSWIVHRHLTEALQKESIRFLHDVCFVDNSHSLTAELLRVFERKHGDSCARFFRHDLQRLDDTGHDLMFET